MSQAEREAVDAEATQRTLLSRGPYAGAVGYLSYSGDVDTCITIRTLVVEGDRTSVTAGAGIVADSDPERELEETRAKARGLLAALEGPE